ncbi:EAL domain-containing protein [Comamonas faecalis]|uniref:EAL domain-containing protein n=1 Tax=Comamonas faecalis TaxID=1387849 RepID=A0ABP7RJJ1_9BURK
MDTDALPSDHSPSPPSHGAMIARQAIMNAQQVVVGYELFNRARTSTAHTAASDMVLVFTALSHAGTEELVGKMLLFVNCTHESLSGGHLDLINPYKVVLEIPSLGHAAQDEVQARLPILQELRARGFSLAFGHQVLEQTYAPWLALADYIKIDLSVLPPDQVSVLINYAARQSQAELIAEKIETAQQYDMVSSLGVQLFQGYWFSRPTLVETKLLTPAQTSTIELLNLVRNQAEVGQLEDALKKDAALTFNLMRLINSAGLGFAHEITSVRQAVMLLGLKRLFRWAALLLTAARDGETPPAVGQTAVLRGRFMELLAQQALPPDAADKAFVTGIFSLLDQMLGLPLDKAVDLLQMPDEVRGALLRHDGALGQLLQLAQACESSSGSTWEQLGSALELSSEQINTAHLQAMAWMNQLRL